MKQQQLSFAGQGHTVAYIAVDRPWVQVTDTIRVKEQPLTHARQTGRTCAYYALAMLMRIEPATVLEMGKRVLDESRLRTFCGKHDLLIETYRRLGYRFPHEELHHTAIPRRADKVELRSFAGSGLMSIKSRPRSRMGHMVAYKAGIVYDSNLSSPSAAEEYLLMLKRRGHRYLRFVSEYMLVRDGNGLTTREQEAQEYLKKRPRQSRRRYTWR